MCVHELTSRKFSLCWPEQKSTPAIPKIKVNKYKKAIQNLIKYHEGNLKWSKSLHFPEIKIGTQTKKGSFSKQLIYSKEE